MTNQNVTHTRKQTKEEKNSRSQVVAAHSCLCLSVTAVWTGAAPTVSYQHNHLEVKQTTGNQQNNSLAVCYASPLQTRNLKILS